MWKNKTILCTKIRSSLYCRIFWNNECSIMMYINVLSKWKKEEKKNKSMNRLMGFTLFEIEKSSHIHIHELEYDSGVEKMKKQGIVKKRYITQEYNIKCVHVENGVLTKSVWSARNMVCHVIGSIKIRRKKRSSFVYIFVLDINIYIFWWYNLSILKWADYFLCVTVIVFTWHRNTLKLNESISQILATKATKFLQIIKLSINFVLQLTAGYFG